MEYSLERAGVGATNTEKFHSKKREEANTKLPFSNFLAEVQRPDETENFSKTNILRNVFLHTFGKPRKENTCEVTSIE